MLLNAERVLVQAVHWVQGHVWYFLAHIEQEKKSGVKKSKKHNITGPNASVAYSQRIW